MRGRASHGGRLMAASTRPGRAENTAASLIIVLLALAVAACSGDPSPDRGLLPIPSPSSIPETSQTPTSQTSAPPTPDQTGSGPVISGMVWDTAFRQLGAARVEIVDGTHAGLSTVTDDSGRFVLRGLFASPTTVRATKEGYAAGTQVWKCSGASCSDPGPVLGFHLNTLAPSIDLAGDY